MYNGLGSEPTRFLRLTAALGDRRRAKHGIY